MATKEQRDAAIASAAQTVRRLNLRGTETAMKGSTYIKVGETRRSMDEKRKQKEIKATLYVNGALVCEVMPVCSADDDTPEGSAIAALWLKFEQTVGQDIRRSRPQEKDGPTASERRTPSRS